MLCISYIMLMRAGLVSTLRHIIQHRWAAPVPILLHCKDIQILTGKTAKLARHLITEVWQQKGRVKQRWITIPDFCQYFDVKEETVIERLDNRK